MSVQPSTPTPELFFKSLNAYEITRALEGAIKLDVFTAIAEGATTAKALAERRQATERGMRILCDYLALRGFLAKDDDNYRLTPDSATFLDRRQPTYLGGMIDFLLNTNVFNAFSDVAAAVRKGGTVLSAEGIMGPEEPVWVEFARAMQPMAYGMAQILTGLIELDPGKKSKALDIAASHGMYGLAFAQRFPNLEVVAVDWANVLVVGRENAEKFGVADRWREVPGNAFEVDFGADYDLVLIPNFFHHFDETTNINLMRKIHSALKKGGRAITVEFIPDEDRSAPQRSVEFALTMLVSTAAGDAYTFAQYDRMFAKAGFSRSELIDPPAAPQRIIISEKR